MSRLDLAEKRLAQALETLEKAAQTAVRRAQDQSGTEALTEERERLLARIAQLEDELSALGSASQEVEGRLDGAIGEIRAALAR
jgi:predicted  nucleic acid-binding Zn-ribbon protein